ncbi:signal peptidase I [Anaerococcus urinomassiliensis]|uniref:signal peptidase I n=1 Tax=Anaerococcus urinomassiliensis TaxID=1745712 RepID=UPI0009E23555|nr:signal peptidase I [Anaerococcus urinomassiliensis]
MTEEKIYVPNDGGDDNKKNKKEESLTDIILDWIKTIAAALLIATVIKMFLIDATKVSGFSMQNTLYHDDMLLVDKIGPRFNDYHRGNIVILKAPDDVNKLYVKRVVGLPGDTIELKDEKVYLNGNELDETYTSVDYTLPEADGTSWTLGEDEYFVMGDNREEGASNDSRNFGPIMKKDIVGHAFFRFYPFDDFGKIDSNPYGNETN